MENDSVRLSNGRQGTAIVLALVFATILLQFAISYSGLIGQSRPQTEIIDERVRLHYLSKGLTEIALLKFQKFPSDFYNCWRNQASTSTNISFWLDTSGPLARFTIEAPEMKEYKTTGFAESTSSFNNTPICFNLTEMRLMTSNRWNVEVLQIKANAHYTTRSGKSINVDAVRTVRTERVTIK
ncbi:MAG TPA: hypothetical protein PLU72_18570 [Candidatus Ozemobacteraceae bacterium]|nr:hypothetical protein [Candidatus Ozemobacteraceae bacterium]